MTHGKPAMQRGTALVFLLLGAGGGFLAAHDTQEPIVKHEVKTIHAPPEVVTEIKYRDTPMVPESCQQYQRYGQLIYRAAKKAASAGALAGNRVHTDVTGNMLDHDYDGLVSDDEYLSDRNSELLGATFDISDALSSLHAVQLQCEKDIDDIQEEQ